MQDVLSAAGVNTVQAPKGELDQGIVSARSALTASEGSPLQLC